MKPALDPTDFPRRERNKDQRKQGKPGYKGQNAHHFVRHQQRDACLACMSCENWIDHHVCSHRARVMKINDTDRLGILYSVRRFSSSAAAADLTDAHLPDYCPAVIGHRHRAGAQGGRPFAVVTGSSRGIGAAYARALASKGYDLLLVARDQAALDRLRSELGAHAVSVRHELIDLSEPEAAHRLYVAACHFRGVPDLLVNNAGFGLFGEFVGMPMARIQQMLRLHINTVVESIRLFLPGMVERRSGFIVNVASIAGLFAVPHMAEYAATKAFLVNFSQALDEEVRRSGVRVQVCCPGSTDTEFHRTAGFRPRNPFGSQRPEQVVRASLSALERGPSLVTVGVSGALLMLVSRCVPRRFLIRGAGRWMKSAV